jgi:hypothetical protein
MRGAQVGLLLGALAAAAVACETVELGPPPADVNACRPSQQFFADQIWPNVLAKDYNGLHCTDSTCHGGGSNNSLRLLIPINPTPPVPLTMEWYDNYISTTQQMKCTNVASSLLLPRSAGMALASELLMFGDPFDAATALRAGIINRVVSEAQFQEVVTERARTLAAKPVEAWRAAPLGRQRPGS